MASIRGKTHWVAALGLIVLALGVRQAIVNKAGLALAQKEDHRRIEPGAGIAQTRGLSNGPKLTESKETPSEIVGRSPPDPAKLAMQTGSQENGEIVPSVGQTSDSASVIGRAFPVSAAIEADCKMKRDHICNDVNDKLAQLAEQPRDPAWASEMEALIQHDVLYEEQPGRFQNSRYRMPDVVVRGGSRVDVQH